MSFDRQQSCDVFRRGSAVLQVEDRPVAKARSGGAIPVDKADVVGAGSRRDVGGVRKTRELNEEAGNEVGGCSVEHHLGVRWQIESDNPVYRPGMQDVEPVSMGDVEENMIDCRGDEGCWNIGHCLEDGGLGKLEVGIYQRQAEKVQEQAQTLLSGAGGLAESVRMSERCQIGEQLDGPEAVLLDELGNDCRAGEKDAHTILLQLLGVGYCGIETTTVDEAIELSKGWNGDGVGIEWMHDGVRVQ